MIGAIIGGINGFLTGRCINNIRSPKSEPEGSALTDWLMAIFCLAFIVALFLIPIGCIVGLWLLLTTI